MGDRVMGLKLNGSTSGYVELVAPAVAGTTTLTLPTDSIQPGLVLITSQSFSAVSTVSVNNCFSTTYDIYKIMLNASNSTAGIDIRMRFSSGGVDDSSSTYLGQEIYGENATVAGGRVSGTSSLAGALNSAGLSCYAYDIFSPALSEETQFIYVGKYGYGGASAIMGSGNHAVSSPFDGFTLFIGTGTMTGNLKVYGYRN